MHSFKDSNMLEQISTSGSCKPISFNVYKYISMDQLKVENNIQLSQDLGQSLNQCRNNVI